MAGINKKQVMKNTVRKKRGYDILMAQKRRNISFTCVLKVGHAYVTVADET